MKRVLSLISFVFISFGTWHAISAEIPYSNPYLSSGAIDASCKETQDPYEVGYRLGTNSMLFSGQCVNQESFRGIQILEHRPDSIKIANYLHNNEYWIAEIPLARGAWNRALFQIIRFAGVQNGMVAGHVQIRLVLNEGHKIRLTSQSGTSRYAETNNFMFSVEAAYPKNVPYSFITGAVNNFAIMARITSDHQRVIENPGRDTEQYLLNFSSDEVVDLARRAIVTAEDMGLKGFYSSMRPNCATGAFDLMDQLPRLRGRSQFNTVMWVDPIIGPSVRGLENRHILVREVAMMGAELRGETQPPAPRPAIEVFGGVIRPRSDMPFALVSMYEDSPAARQLDRQVLVQARQAITAAVPHLAQSVILPAMQRQGGLNGVMPALQQAYVNAQSYLRRINRLLPNHPVNVWVYLIPWDRNLPPATFQNSGLAIDLPYNIQLRGAESADGLNAVMSRIHSKLSAFQAREITQPANTPVFLQGLAIKMTLQRNRSYVTTQSLLSFVPRRIPVQIGNELVRMDRVLLPLPIRHSTWMWSTPVTERASMLITHTQRYNENITPEVRFDFGPLNPLTANTDGASRGMFSVGHNQMRPYWEFTAGRMELGSLRTPRSTYYVGIPNLDLSCGGVRAHLVPQIAGRIVGNPTGIDFVNNQLRGREIWLGLYSFNLVYADHVHGADQRATANSRHSVVIENMDVRARVAWGIGPVQPLNCLQLSQIRQPVIEQANAAIDQFVDQVLSSENDFIGSIFGGL